MDWFGGEESSRGGIDQHEFEQDIDVGIAGD